MLLVNARVGISKIHGFGLIAQEFIPKGTVTWKLVPGFDCLFSEEELKSFPPSVQAQVHHYGHYDSERNRYVLCSDDARFTNHSDEPTELSCGDYSVAARDIQPGEEITCDYGDFVHQFNVLQEAR